MSKAKNLTNVEKDFLYEIMPQKSTKEIRDLFREKFNRDICSGTIRNLKYKKTPCSNRNFTQEQKDFLLTMVQEKTPQEICDLFYKKFNRKICVGTIINYKCKYNKDRKEYKRIKLNDNQKKWLLNMLPHRDNVEAIELFKNKFGIELNEFNLRNFRTKYKVKRVYKPKIRDTRFRDKIKKPLYNEINDNRGRTYVRVDARKYQIKTRFMWEKYHGIKIPKDYEVIFLDGDNTNYNEDNLVLIKKATRQSLLMRGIVPCDKDIIKTADIILKLNKKGDKKKKEHKDMWLKDIFKKEREKEEVETNNNLYELALEKCKNNEEIWADVKEYDNLAISNLGRVKNKFVGDILEINPAWKDKVGASLTIVVNGRKKREMISKLMSTSFGIPNERNKVYIHHIDRDLNNNRLDNLTYEKWNTASVKPIEDVEYNDKDRIDRELANKRVEINETPEVWRDVVNYERWYEVSNKGNVRRIEIDGSKTLLKATYKEGRPRSVGLRMTGPTKTYQIKALVARAFGINPTENNDKIIYNINGDMSNDCSYNLTYDYKQTEAYIKEQEQLEREKEQDKNKEELLNYIENNKVFLKMAQEKEKEITLRDIYDKLNELIEVIKNDNR